MSEPVPPCAHEDQAVERAAPLIEHFTELRSRLLWVLAMLVAATAGSYMVAAPVYGFLVRPLAEAMGPEGTHRLIYTNLTEAFFTYLKIAFYCGLFLTVPVLLTQIWRFVAPGLYKSEKRVLLPFMIASPLLFILGMACVYYVVLPMAWPFFLSFQTSADQTALPIQLEARIGEYLDLTLSLMFAFGLCFQLPVLMGILARAGLVRAEHLIVRRRYAIVAIFVVAAVLTPPDVFSQILLALPLIGLYEISILVVRRIGQDKLKGSRPDPIAPPGTGS
ncbi:MAG TPA: twin-arginine translocase subunit TatC [Alphaproteobacteria bacterium]|nr:twin-arginine translocase subunit TatC [Alphaproteobacteria bacterium]